MKSIRPQLDSAKAQYLATGYPGDLASDVLGSGIGLPASLAARRADDTAIDSIGNLPPDGSPLGQDSESAYHLRQRWWWAGAGSMAAAAVLTFGFLASRGGSVGTLPAGGSTGNVAGLQAFPGSGGGVVPGAGTTFVVNPNPFAANPQANPQPNVTAVDFNQGFDRGLAQGNTDAADSGVLSPSNFNGTDPASLSAIGRDGGIVFGPAGSVFRIGTPVMPPAMPVSRFELFQGAGPNLVATSSGLPPATRPAELMGTSDMTLEPQHRSRR